METLGCDFLPSAKVFLDRGVIEWDGSQWKWDPERSFFSEEHSFPDLVEHYIKWISAMDTIHVENPANGQVSAYDLTQGEIPIIHDANRNPFGWTNLLIELEGGQYAVTSILGEEKPEIWYTIKLPTADRIDMFRSYLLSDPQGDPILFLGFKNYCRNDTYIQMAGRLDLVSGEWTWRELTFPNDCEYSYQQEKPLIDPLGRIWIEGRDQVAVFSPEVFVEPDPTSTPLMIYSERNSNYTSTDTLNLQEDGKIWALDSLGDKLIWIDSTQKNLPEPMPSWVEWILYISEPRIIPYFILLFAFMIPAYIYWFKERRALKDIAKRHQEE